ncbi:hypothetical protein M422DRAFT_31470 [Sphaerobolus stellatus SS14]|uniref:ZZ-type domain-containing protein n=1 Tax=Sphaerobolus stellatus (strain SS14) TaxID=990650 RepID=A0A0C9V5B0_SPHS4|nr:hypothetical protein M422DRAFT_31470 [Sphaerobolus stellatus SS14]
MATATSVSVNATQGDTITILVENDDISMLMYYLDCVTVGIGLDILPKELMDFAKHRSLSPAQRALVFSKACELSPDKFIDKFIFRDDTREMINNGRNSFWTIEAACKVVSLQRDLFIAGKVQTATEVMFFETSWLDDAYTHPMQRLSRPFTGSAHCLHCQGDFGPCLCSNCPRFEDSECSSARPPSPSRSPHQHRYTCDGCGVVDFEGSLYLCTVCTDFGFCQTCYMAKDHNIAHRFSHVNYPGATPVLLEPRLLRPTQASVSHSSPALHLSSFSPQQHWWICDGCHAEYFEGSLYMCTVCTDFGFCQTCYSTKGHDTAHRFNHVNYPGATPVLLGPRLPPSVSAAPPQASYPTSTSQPATQDKPLHLHKNGKVKLTGLSRADMNGKHAIVIEDDCGNGRVEVRIEEMEKNFKVKLENITAASDSEEDFLD